MSVCVCVYVCEGHTLKPAALKCALAADCKVESDNPETMHRQRLTQYVVFIPRLMCGTASSKASISCQQQKQVQGRD